MVSNGQKKAKKPPYHEEIREGEEGKKSSNRLCSNALGITKNKNSEGMLYNKGKQFRRNITYNTKSTILCHV